MFIIFIENNNKYKDLIEQTFNFPQEEFQIKENKLLFHKIDMIQLVEKYDTPLKFTYLPKILENINRAKHWFNKAILKLNYEGTYHYFYCTKSSHFKYVLEEALKNTLVL